jgi:glycosyltransferase involved in cell wall biosynthesis
VLRPISARYLIVLSVPAYKDDAGGVYVDELWQKDLQQHLTYLKRLTIACPIARGPHPANYVSLEEQLASGLKILDLPNPDSFTRAILALPAIIEKLWKAIGRSDIIHSSVAGWPVPLGWIAIPIAKLRRKPSVVVVESAFWRITPEQPLSLRRRVRASLSEVLNRWCVRSADLSIFTQVQYQNSLLGHGSRRGHVIHASWIDQGHILDRSDACESWRQKSRSTPRFLFVGRLVAGKGILVLLDAMKRLEAAKIMVDLDILGAGDLFEVCRHASELPTKFASIKMLGTIAYGAEFRKMVRAYHAIVVPSITDEQPRIVYDAYAQAVPVLASNTDGLRSCVNDQGTGRLVIANDPRALAELLEWASENREKLEAMGLTALAAARSLTHQEMHKQRWLLLQDLLDTRPKPAG